MDALVDLFLGFVRLSGLLKTIGSLINLDQKSCALKTVFLS